MQSCRNTKGGSSTSGCVSALAFRTTEDRGSQTALQWDARDTALLTCCKLGRTYLSAVCSSDKGCCSQVGAMSSRIASISVCRIHTSGYTHLMRGPHKKTHSMRFTSDAETHRLQAAGCRHSMQLVELSLLWHEHCSSLHLLGLSAA